MRGGTVYDRIGKGNPLDLKLVVENFKGLIYFDPTCGQQAEQGVVHDKNR
jgi:hypothetical protein